MVWLWQNRHGSCLIVQWVLCSQAPCCRGHCPWILVARQLKVRDRTFQLRENLYLVGFGKAVLGMAAAAEELLAQHLVQGVISVPKGIRAAMEHAGKK